MSNEPEMQPEFSQMFLRMTELWRTSMEKSGEAGKLWSQSMMPFLTTRVADSSLFAAAQGGEISEAIKRMVEGPRLADMMHLDREVFALMAAWLDIRQRMAAYQATVSVPWTRAFERYSTAFAEKNQQDDGEDFDWRKAFAAWSAIANEELIRNQRSDEFLSAQRELLKSALELRSHQQAISDSFGKLFGFPTQQDFDELTRQVTELRRELRGHLRARRDAAPVSEKTASDGDKDERSTADMQAVTASPVGPRAKNSGSKRS